MTTLVLNYSTNLLERFSSGLKKALQGVMIGYMISRQTQANYHVAQMLIDAGEYRQDQYYNLVHELNQKTIKAAYEKYND